MGCADYCLSSGYDPDAGDFCREAIVRAAKRHDCCECGGAINRGDRYQRASGKSGGAMWSQITCLPCAEIRETFCCDGWIYTELWQSVCEELFPAWERDMFGLECLARLAKQASDSAVAKMRAEYDSWRE